MDKILTGLSLIITLPICLGISWLAGVIFRGSVLKHDLNNGNKIIQNVVSIAIGLFVLFILVVITNKMGCTSNDDTFIRE
jgi:ABC-type phosphate transport system permease subunit